MHLGWDLNRLWEGREQKGILGFGVGKNNARQIWRMARTVTGHNGVRQGRGLRTRPWKV